MNRHPNRPQSWRDFQKVSKKGLRKRHLLSRLPWLGFWIVGFALMLGILVYSGTWISAHLGQMEVEPEARPEGQVKKPDTLKRVDMGGLLKELDFSVPPFHEKYSLSRNGGTI